ncbi:large conductance mechanosensitive channel protein MscL [Actinocorallia longicatena]|uniref:Large conductance mechanosensitive channel protein MscL n=1 Tax=Actinocorallia longicatena TaxID=111803 RepID=A0ABP6Q9R0_9ACTN
MFDGLKKFLLRGNLVELAVAVVIGAQFSGLVNQFVKSFISPLLSLVGGDTDLSRLKFTINKSVFTYGDFLTVLIAFVIAAVVVYFVLVLPVARVVAFIDRNKEATERECPHCISSIPIRARVCAHCGHEVPTAAPSAAG